MCRLLPTSRAQPIPSADLHCSLLRPDNSDHTWLSTAYQPSSRCLQLTCLVLIYGPTTPFTHVQATVYHPSSGCLQLTCLALLRPHYSFRTYTVHCLPTIQPMLSADLPCSLLRPHYSFLIYAPIHCLPAAQPMPPADLHCCLLRPKPATTSTMLLVQSTAYQPPS